MTFCPLVGRRCEEEAAMTNALTGLCVAVLLLGTTAACDDTLQNSERPSSAEAIIDPSDLVVTFLGTGAPRPSLERYGPSFLVEAGDHRVLVDAGSGLKHRLLQAGSFELITGLDHVLVTHLHYDHTIELSDLWLTGWLYGRRVPLRIQGPPGTKAMMDDIARAFEWDVEYRITVGLPAAGAEIEATDVSPGVIFDQDELTITAFDVEHMPIDLTTRERLDFPGRTYGYRFDYGDHSAVFSGDTRPSDNLVEHALGADVLIHEVQVPAPGASAEANLANVSLSVHSTPEQVSDVFARVRPRMAVYAHIIPPQVTSEELIAATSYDGPLTVAHDLMMMIIGDHIDVIARREVGMESFEDTGVLR